jgi:hypothetical protein
MGFSKRWRFAYVEVGQNLASKPTLSEFHVDIQGEGARCLRPALSRIPKRRMVTDGGDETDLRFVYDI